MGENEPSAEAIEALLPPDAPAGHEAWKKVTLSVSDKWPLARFQFGTGQDKVWFQTTIGACGTQELTERVARACYMKFENGSTMEDVKAFRKDCYDKLKDVVKKKDARGKAQRQASGDSKEMPKKVRASAKSSELPSGSPPAPAQAPGSPQPRSSKRRRAANTEPVKHEAEVLADRNASGFAPEFFADFDPRDGLSPELLLLARHLEEHIRSALRISQGQIAELGHAMQEKASTNQIEQLKSSLVGVELQMSGMEQALHEKASSKSLDAAVAQFHGDVRWQTLVRLQRLEERVSSLNARTGDLGLEEIDTNFTKIEARMNYLENSLQEKVSTVQMQSVVSGINAQITSMDQSLHEKVGTEQMQQTKASLSILNAQVAAVEQTASGKADAEQMQQVNSVVSGIHDLEGAHNDHIHRLEEAMAAMRAQLKEIQSLDISSKIANLERSRMNLASSDRLKMLQDAHENDRNSIRQLHETVLKLEAELSDVTKSTREKATVLQVGELEHRITAKADKSRADGLQDNLAAMQTSLLSTLEENVNCIEQAMAQKASIEQARTFADKMDKEVANLYQALAQKANVEQVRSFADRVEEKAANSQLEQFIGSHSSLQAQVSDLQDGLKEKVCLTKMNSTTMAWQIQMTQIENSLQQKVDLETIQQLSCIASGFDMKVNTLAQDLQSGANHMQLFEASMARLEKQLLEVREEKAGLNKLQMVEDSLEGIEIKMKGIDSKVQLKPSAEQLREFERSMSQVEAHISKVDASLHIGAAKLPHLENSMASIRAQVASLEQSSLAKADRRTVQAFENSMEKVEAGIAKLEQQANYGASRLQHLEDQVVYRRGPDVSSRSFQGDPQAGVHVGDGFMTRGVKEAFANKKQGVDRDHASNSVGTPYAENPFRGSRRSNDGYGPY